MNQCNLAVKRRQRQKSLDNLVTKIARSESSDHSQPEEKLVEPSCSSSSPSSTAYVGDISEVSGSLMPMRKNDIGLFIDSNEIDDFTRRELLERPWTPPRDFKMPYSIHKKKGRDEKRFLNHSHLEKFPWLVYSDAKKGLFCKYCSLFVVNNVGGSNKHVPLRKLVTEPHSSFAKLLGTKGDLITHENNQYHKEAVQGGKDFLRTFYEPSLQIQNQLDSIRAANAAKNRERLKSIVESIIFLGRQNIAFRGHRDDGAFQIESPCDNEGNFRELLRHRIRTGDSTLRSHLENAPANATYISKTTQNELITCCGEEIKNVILKRIKQAKFYCVIIDETTDISHTSQLAICISYVHQNRRREDFVEFIDVHDSCFKEESPCHEPKVDGKTLGRLVLSKMEDLGLDLLNCVGIGTDGCAMMISEEIGVIAEIKTRASNASRCPCFNHALNLSLSKSSKVPSIRNSIATVKGVVSFFKASAKRNHVLLGVVAAQLKGMCETRWVEKTESLTKFLGQLPNIITALEYISDWSETGTASQARSLMLALRDVDFVIALSCQLSVFSLCRPLTKIFQKKDLDLSEATSLISDLLTILKTQRQNCELTFHEIFLNSSNLLSSLDIEVKQPRINSRQNYRCNTPSSSTEEYYRRSIYIPMLDCFICDLENRFSNQTSASFHLSSLLPRNCLQIDPQMLSKIIQDAYSDLLGGASLFEFLCAEIKLWKQKWVRISSKGAVALPLTVEETLLECDEDVFSLVHSLLKILLTLPVSVATAERSFSALRQLKTWLRSNTGETRLTGLALLHQHRDIQIDVEAVVTRYATSGNRRLDLM